MDNIYIRSNGRNVISFKFNGVDIMNPERIQQTCPLENDCKYGGEEVECEDGNYSECQYFAQVFDRKWKGYNDKVRRKF